MPPTKHARSAEHLMTKALPALRKFAWVVVGRGEHTGEDFQAQALFVAQAVVPFLDGADLVVEPFDNTQRHLVFQTAAGGDALPMPLDHGGELLAGL